MSILEDAENLTQAQFSEEYGNPPDLRTAVMLSSKLILEGIEALQNSGGASSLSTAALVTGSIAQANVSQQVVALASGRIGFEFFNCSPTYIMWLSVGTGVTPNASGKVGIPIVPHGGYVYPNGLASTLPVYVCCESANEKYSYIDFYQL